MARDSIQRERAVTGAKAMSASLFGRGPESAWLRTKRFRAGPAEAPGRTGFHVEAGASDESRGTFLGPVRRSIVPAIAWRQLRAASARSFGERETRTSFAASAKVSAVTSGPTAGPVPKAGGVPAAGVGSGGGAWPSPRADVARPTAPAAALARKSR